MIGGTWGGYDVLGPVYMVIHNYNSLNSDAQ